MSDDVPNLHDGMLDAIAIDFAGGTAELHVISHAEPEPRTYVLQVSGFRRIVVDRDQPWGRSKYAYIMSASGGTERLDVQMQSGDHLLFYGPDMTISFPRGKPPVESKNMGAPAAEIPIARPSE